MRVVHLMRLGCGLLLIPSVAQAQGLPGTNLSVDVRVSSVSTARDTVSITYSLFNRQTSRERFIGLTVDAPAPATKVEVPQPADDWSVHDMYRGSSVVRWWALDPILPGASTPSLSFRAVGLPGIVTAWYRGDSLPSLPSEENYVEPDPSLPNPPPPNLDPLTDLSVAIQTVGIEPIPFDATVSSLTIRLDGLTAQACTLSWITDAALCATLRGHLAAQPARLTAFRSDLVAGHTTGGPVTDNGYWLLKVNADYLLSLAFPPAPAPQPLFLHGSGGTANPPTLFPNAAPPTGTTVKYQDSPAIQFAGGNSWKAIGTWIVTPNPVNGTLTAAGGIDVWIGLQNSDDVGTNFDLRVELYKNGALISSGQSLCIQGVTRNPSSAKRVVVPFAPFPATSFNGTTDVLSLKELTRVGTNSGGGACGGHSNAVGLRSYFDATTRAATFTVTF